MAEVRFGEPARAKCGATGIYLDYGVVLYVSAQDNDLGMDAVDRDREPVAGLPLPSKDEVSAAHVAVVYMTAWPAALTGGGAP